MAVWRRRPHDHVTAAAMNKVLDVIKTTAANLMRETVLPLSTSVIQLLYIESFFSAAKVCFLLSHGDGKNHE